MKKLLSILLCLALSFAMTGCGGSSSGKPSGNKTAGVNDVLEQGMAEADGKNTENTSRAAENNKDHQNTADPKAQAAGADAASAPAENAEGIDVDLTALSSTMVYSEVYNMMNSPETYIGKTVKMKGQYAHFHDNNTNNDYFACIIKDATACCSQGIEFVLTDDYAYPDDYPDAEEEICVVGVFDTYKEGRYLYCTLRDAKLI